MGSGIKCLLSGLGKFLMRRHHIAYSADKNAQKWKNNFPKNQLPLFFFFEKIAYFTVSQRLAAERCLC
jgi:hypothetical protein